ncbi:MAG: hypothetical protein ACJA1O_001333 [Spirosomataceae bacterium]|jgi:hypothetical protein
MLIYKFTKKQPKFVSQNQKVDNPESLANIVEALLIIAESNKVFLPLHPRTRQAIQQLPMTLKNHFISNKNITISPPGRIPGDD